MSKPVAIIAGCATSLFLATAFAEEQLDTGKSLGAVFARETELTLALSAAPEHLRAGATVYVYGTSGFTKAQDGANGFTCLLNRAAFYYGSAVFKPTCWDAEGATSYVPVMLEVGRLLAAGKGRDEIRSEIDEGFRTKRFHRPTRSGIAYMLAGDVVLDKTGAVTSTVFPGHYMIYAPGVTSADIGYSADAAKQNPSLPFIFAGGAGGRDLAYMITVPHH